ncbi:prolyl-tRNA editing protein [Vagococcus penaei]|uniref:Prolyl-tRNA editing protein n=2 Tax=Vagococcus penaei TaxID=633807 RepID=A0A1Q2D5S0_9ENTE|nr:prolyl-tRNA editing protein [Vagococcus penaei]RSU00393.1 prolyl-tRNA editing protein [Vagococcus penaei]
MVATEQEAYDLINKLEIEFKAFEHPPITSVKEMPYEFNSPLVKNLVLKAKKGKNIYLVILPREKQADLKKLATLLDEKRLSFLAEDALLELLNVPAGTVTPLALPNDTNHQLTVVIDRDIDQEDTVGFHPNVNTATLIMPFKELLRILDYLDYEPIYIRL